MKYTMSYLHTHREIECYIDPLGPRRATQTRQQQAIRGGARTRLGKWMMRSHTLEVKHYALDEQLPSATSSGKLRPCTVPVHGICNVAVAPMSIGVVEFGVFFLLMSDINLCAPLTRIVA